MFVLSEETIKRCVALHNEDRMIKISGKKDCLFVKIGMRRHRLFRQKKLVIVSLNQAELLR